MMRRGSAAIEFGLTLPVGLMILAGAIDGGVYMVESTVASRAARDGARVGSMTMESTAPPTGALIEAAAKSAAQASLTAAGITTGKVTVTTDWFQDAAAVSWIKVDVQVAHEGFFGNLTPFGDAIQHSFLMVTQEQL
jgi:Flp pilus assembly protein TadG